MKFPHVLIASLFLISCASLYELPEPPPPNERKSAVQAEDTDSAASERAYLEARAAIIVLYNLLQQQRYGEAVEKISAETRDFLTHGTSQSAQEILASRQLTIDNQVVEIDPVSMLLAEDVSQLVESVAGVEEQETSSRKEIFAVVPGGFRRIVMIQESGQWVLHRTRPSTLIPSP